MTTFVDMAPAAGTLQNIEDAKYMMTQRPLAKEATLTHVDLLRLPDDFKDIKIVPITLLAEAVPAGLISGDRISLYDRSKDANSSNGLIEAVVVEVEPMSRPVTDGVKLDVTRLTLAVQSNDLNYFISLPNCSADNLLCIVLQPPETAGLPSTRQVDLMSDIVLPKCIADLLDEDERSGRKKIHFIWRKKPWRKENNILDWEDVKEDEELDVAFNCLVADKGKKLCVPAEVVKMFPGDTIEAQHDSKEAEDSQVVTNTQSPYLEKLTMPSGSNPIPSSWGYWKAKIVETESMPEKHVPKTYTKYNGADSWEPQYCCAAGFIITKPAEEKIEDYTPESYFGVTGLICKIKTAGTLPESKLSVRFLVGKGENRIDKDLFVFDVVLYSDLINNMDKLEQNIQNEPEHLSKYGDISGARHYLIDMASALVLLDLIRHPEEVSATHKPDLHA